MSYVFLKKYIYFVLKCLIWSCGKACYGGEFYQKKKWRRLHNVFSLDQLSLFKTVNCHIHMHVGALILSHSIKLLCHLTAFTGYSFFPYKVSLKLFTPTFTALWANSAEDKLMIFFLVFSKIRLWQFMQRRQFAWNVTADFLGKILKIFQVIVCRNFYPAC